MVRRNTVSGCLITFEEDQFTFDLEESIADFASEANNAAAISLSLEVLLKQLSDEDAKLVSYLKITCDKSTKRTATYISRYGKVNKYDYLKKNCDQRSSSPTKFTCKDNIK